MNPTPQPNALASVRLPRVFTASEIALWHIAEEFEPGKWRPARPCPIHGFRFMERLRAAWRVFTGRWDALNWGDHSGEWTNAQASYRDCWEKGFILAGKEKQE